MKFYDWSKEIKQLESGERKVILEVNEVLDQMFYDGYLKMDEDVFVTVMNLLIKLCIIYKDERSTFENLLNTVLKVRDMREHPVWISLRSLHCSPIRIFCISQI